jgi:hypothetical protein
LGWPPRCMGCARLGVAASRMGSRLGVGLARCSRNRLRSGNRLRHMLALERLELGERLLRPLLRIRAISIPVNT